MNDKKIDKNEQLNRCIKRTLMAIVNTTCGNVVRWCIGCGGQKSGGGCAGGGRMCGVCGF